MLDPLPSHVLACMPSKRLAAKHTTTVPSSAKPTCCVDACQRRQCRKGLTWVLQTPRVASMQQAVHVSLAISFRSTHETVAETNLRPGHTPKLHARLLGAGGDGVT